MGSATDVIVPLCEAAGHGVPQLGGKAVALGRMIEAGHRVPDGFCIAVSAYEQFVAENRLDALIGMELNRKAFASMRWEEMWDAALRIRSAFLRAAMPPNLVNTIAAAHDALRPGAMVVRSSAPGEDSENRSFAGLHESLVGVVGAPELLDAVRVVWASLWSDAAILYRQELDADPRRSRMAVVVQAFAAGDVSGVAFGMDPRDPARDIELIEAVPGACEGLVSGEVDPDRWIIKRSSGEIVQWHPGKRGGNATVTLLEPPHLAALHQTLHSLESLFGWKPDVEWTGRAPELTLLQARPITGPANDEDDKAWYMTLRPKNAQLNALCERVTQQLIPQLTAEADDLAAEDVESLGDGALASAIDSRDEALKRWKKVYWDEFIPFAHGVRRLGQYYNDAVRPEDPYEFVGLLENQPMLASRRNAILEKMAHHIRGEAALLDRLETLVDSGAVSTPQDWKDRSTELPTTTRATAFIAEFESFLDEYMNVSYDGEMLDERPDLMLRVVLELARGRGRDARDQPNVSARLEAKLLSAVGESKREVAHEIVRVARLSWQLRDDDNILLGRIENQLRRTLKVGAERLGAHNRIGTPSAVDISHAAVIANALRDPSSGRVTLPGKTHTEHQSSGASGETPRQLIGQPAAAGYATGTVRTVRSAADIGRFRRGEVLVCDAIQPTMTHLLPLASAVVERRGGMLIHGAIIARELGIACVNGVAEATEILSDGDLVTVDGHLGIVTIGPPEFDLEKAFGDSGRGKL